MVWFFFLSGLILWFTLFSIMFRLNSDFLFRNFWSIPSDTKVKWSFGANSREEITFLNLDYLSGPNTWIINVKYVADFNEYVFWSPLNYQIFCPTQKYLKKAPIGTLLTVSKIWSQYRTYGFRVIVIRFIGENSKMNTW